MTKRVLSAEEQAKLASIEQRVSGTENFRLPGDGPVGRRGIEADSIRGHDNLEAPTEVQKDMEDQGKNPEGSRSFETNPKKLG